ncbi:pantothenate kinase, type III [Synechococcus sp. PCC 7502]|uniref:type III pantothenate kinase n=1 Tax=Synechococcus sp. PCC 7502 TaxID=1173263 RepID=UPI00029F8182|nr:type III pantothenate kinase [Synechococcus sp. PCC 7502]AFY75400.1 pantothenate kinase, type III [Synechococcus sp. PCC 7502]
MPDLVIAIGNTRIRAAVFEQGILVVDYAYAHNQTDLLKAVLEEYLGARTLNNIAIATVVPELITPWHHLPQTQMITKEMIPLSGIYPTMGLDRVLTALGAWLKYKSPVLVIDCGTAISLTGINGDRRIIGGAILAGLRMQLQSLNRATAALPLIDLPADLSQNLIKNFPSRWATDTPSAIYSGLIYTVAAGLEDFIEDWRSLYANTQIIFTGGDSELIIQFLNSKSSSKLDNSYLSQVQLDKNLIFKGIAAIF